jgi:hypothetical protein
MTHIIHLGADNSSDRAATLGGTPSQPGPHGAVTQYTSGAEIISFPSRFLPDSQDSGPEPFILSFDIREIGALFLVGALAFVMLAGFASIVFLYLTLVS